MAVVCHSVRSGGHSPRRHSCPFVSPQYSQFHFEKNIYTSKITYTSYLLIPVYVKLLGALVELLISS